MRYDILNYCNSHFSQPLPLVIRDMLKQIGDRSSTTARIRKLAGFKLQLLSTKPHRDVKIFNGAKLFMYARTEIPKQTQIALKDIFSFCHDKPLGDFLFNCSAVKRGNVSLTLSQTPLEWMHCSHQSLYWIRVTWWHYQACAPIKLIEVFI